jgi:hypothetical protein
MQNTQIATAGSDPRIQLFQAAISIWILGWTLAFLVGRGRSYVHATEHGLFAPVRWSLRILRAALRQFVSLARRIGSGIVRQLVHLLSHW